MYSTNPFNIYSVLRGGCCTCIDCRFASPGGRRDSQHEYHLYLLKGWTMPCSLWLSLSLCWGAGFGIMDTCLFALLGSQSNRIVNGGRHWHPQNQQQFSSRPQLCNGRYFPLRYGFFFPPICSILFGAVSNPQNALIHIIQKACFAAVLQNSILCGFLLLGPLL